MNLKNLAMWVVIVVLTIGLYNMFKNPQNLQNKNNKTIIFSEFLIEVDNGRVVEVQIQGNNINVVRPLLDFSKEDLLYVTKNTFNFYIDDPSNKNLEYLRSRVRFMINNLKKNGLDEKKFKMTFENLISSNNSIEFFVQKNISENSFISPSKNNNKAILSLKFFSSTDEIILRSFTKILQDISGRYFPARGKGVLRIINQIKQKSLTKTTIGGCVIEKIENSVVISKENTK